MSDQDDSRFARAEDALRRSFVNASVADFRVPDESNEPATGASWGPERTVRSSVLYELLTTETPGARAVVLRGARIAGPLELEAAQLCYPLLLEGCFFDAPVNLRHARADLLRLTGCRLTCVVADELDARTDVAFDRSTIALLTLRSAHIGGDLSLHASTLTGAEWPPDLAGATLVPPSEPTLHDDHMLNVAALADRLQVDGSMFCGGDFSAVGTVRLQGARIGGSLSFAPAKLRSFRSRGQALSADGIKVEGDLFFDGLEASGEVSLAGAQIGGQLGFNPASLSKERGRALNAQGVTVAQSMYVHVLATGEVSLIGAHVGGQLSFNGATLRNQGGIALSIYEAEVARSLWLEFAEPPQGDVDLRRARVGSVHDSEATWPEALSLLGLTYDHIQGKSDIPVKRRLGWLERDPMRYMPQPYEQLARFYRQTGREKDARVVAITNQRRRRKTLPLAARVWSVLVDATIGYGYRTWLTGVWLLVLTTAGAALFDSWYPRYFKPAKAVEQIPAFDPIVYTLDLLLPVVNLHQDDAWIALGPAQYGAALTVAGWLLATAFVAALTGLVRRD